MLRGPFGLAATPFTAQKFPPSEAVFRLHDLTLHKLCFVIGYSRRLFFMETVVTGLGIAGCGILLLLFVLSQFQETEETAATVAFLEKGKGLFAALHKKSMGNKEMRTQFNRDLFAFFSLQDLEFTDVREFSQLPTNGAARLSYLATIWKGKAHYYWAALFQIDEGANRVEMFVFPLDSLVPSPEEILRGMKESKVILAFRIHD